MASVQALRWPLGPRWLGFGDVSHTRCNRAAPVGTTAYTGPVSRPFSYVSRLRTLLCTLPRTVNPCYVFRFDSSLIKSTSSYSSILVWSHKVMRFLAARSHMERLEPPKAIYRVHSIYLRHFISASRMMCNLSATAMVYLQIPWPHQASHESEKLRHYAPTFGSRTKLES